MITEHEISLARHCISFARQKGADGIRIALSKSSTDSCNMLNGALDKVSHSADRSIYLYLFVDGRYGTFSTNRLMQEDLEDLIVKGIDMVRMLEPDPSRRLPDPSRTEKNAKTGREVGLYDESIERSSSERRISRAMQMSIFNDHREDPLPVISEECEYSETYDDSYMIDSQGFEGRHTESIFSYFSEITIEDASGNKYSSYWWESSPSDKEGDLKACSKTALKKALDQIGPRPRRSGRYRMVVDTSVASRLVSPLINALNGSALQQHMSFLEDAIGKKVFSEGLTLMDLPRTFGKNGSRLFDSEGVATVDAPVIKDGIVMKYFINTYNANKMDVEPTVEDVSRPILLPFMKGKRLPYEENEVSLEDILKFCGNGILVTGFNGGNSNPVTGDFSFGIEGFAFSRGKITHPVREMLITGNLTELWNNLTAVGTDMRPCVRWQIPTIAFEGVAFSG